MTTPTLEIEGTSVVLLGSFNPLIFQPAWLGAEGLVAKEEVDPDHVTVEMIHPQLVAFETDWFAVEVIPERFLIAVLRPEFVDQMHDLVVSILRLLPFTPVQAMGLNRDVHYRVSDEAAWHQVGHHFAPKEHWEGILDQPGMRSLTIEGVRPDNFAGHVRVRVEPSVRIHPGVFIEVNDHYRVQEPGNSQGCGEIASMLEASRYESPARAEAAITHVLGIAT